MRVRNVCVAAASSCAPDKAHYSEETTVAIHHEVPDSACAGVPVQGSYVPTGAIQIDLHRLELACASTRIVNVPAVQQLTDSIRERGQLVPCIAAGSPVGGPLVLIDGYRRVSALRRAGFDTALVQCWRCSVGEAITQLLAQSCSRQFDRMHPTIPPSSGIYFPVI
nr:ParB/RepB/Spo0J family partition protein [Massilia sp. DJPM01]